MIAHAGEFTWDEILIVLTPLLVIAALLWRLPILGINIPLTRQTKPLHDYMDRMFARASCLESLSQSEREMRRR